MLDMIMVHILAKNEKKKKKKKKNLWSTLKLRRLHSSMLQFQTVIFLILPFSFLLLIMLCHHKNGITLQPTVYLLDKLRP